MAAEFTPVQAVDALVPAITLLGFGAASALVSKAARLSPIVGYLIVGILIGPHGLRLIQESSATHLLAELGVVFLLFDIGMHVSMRELKESRRDLLGLAPAHLLLTGLISAGALAMIGIDWAIALAVGLSLGLSSTAVVARILTERGQNSCPMGRAATHVLIFQDMVAIFLMIFATSLGGEESGPTGLAGFVSTRLLDGANLPLAISLGLSLVQAGLAFFAAVLAGKYLIDPIFRTLAVIRNEEAFTAFTLLFVLAAACATAMTGLSLTLGAFLAGLAVSGTPYRHEVQTEMAPFRSLLLSFFFMAIGLSIDMPALMRNLPLVLLAAGGLLALKTVLGYAAARLNGWSVPGAVQLGFLLAQGSEFTLVVLSLGAIMTGMPAALMGSVVAAVALSLALAPVWAGLGGRLSRTIAHRAHIDMTETSAPGPALDQPVIVAGMTQTGRLAIDALHDHGIPYLATEFDPDRMLRAVADGYHVSFGDASNMKLIEAIGGNQARALVLGLPRYEVSRDVTPTINRRFPNLKRFVTVDSPEEFDRYSALGIRTHLGGGQPHGIEMVIDMLTALGVPEDRVSAWLSHETERYAIGEAKPAEGGDDLDPAETDISKAA
ncbi:MAG TPA: cation:proton antiporter [Hyphomonas sp.]|nr:cation:proton antiporter [Hyphomonas sp.]HRX72861.1 cation:proton antiporter [Hyphomonas sp.]